MLGLKVAEICLGEVGEARDDVLANQLLGALNTTLLGGLDLQLAFAKVEVEDFFDAGAGGRGHLCFVLGDLVAAGDSQVDATLTHKGRDVGGGQEDEGNGQVLDQGNVEAAVAVELDVAAVEQVETGLVQAALC